jgi:hypothetical protein
MGKIVHAFEGTSCVDVWLQAVEFLLQETPALNIVLGIETPDRLSAADYSIQNRVDEFFDQHGALRISTVATTIFPGSEFLHGGSREVYEEFPKVFSKIREGWGTYAMRMLTKSLPTADGKGLQSPLEQIISKMKLQRETSRMRSIYESVLIENEDVLTDIPIYKAETDSKHIRGRYLPCLSYLSFKLLPDDTVALTAMYRYHYYVQRALGNLFGLAQLQAFVAAEVGGRVGPLVCHSTYATIDIDSWSMNEVETLVKECQDIASTQVAVA